MKASSLFHSFRVRFILVLAGLLFATLAVQYTINLSSERKNERTREMQERALIAGVSLGVHGITSTSRLSELRQGNQQFDEVAGRVANVIIVNNEWRVFDSLKEEQWPEKQPDGSYKMKALKEIVVPPLVNAEEMGADIQYFPQSAFYNGHPVRAEAQAFPITTDQGRWFVVVVLKSDKESRGFWNQQAARPLIYTLGVLLVAILSAAYLVWRFTRPMAALATGAQKVAAGDLDFRISDYDRRDEMGQLASQFNEMIEKLSNTRDLENRLRQAEQSAAIGRLASAIAHEIRNPLNFINLSLDHMRESYTSVDPAKREMFDKLTTQLKAEVVRINSLIDRFLNYSRPYEFTLKPLDLAEEVANSLDLVRPQAAEAGVEINFDTGKNSPTPVPRIMGDPEPLRSVFTNLFLNALQAMEGEGNSLTVRIDPAPDRSQVRLSVTDTGRGIQPEDLSRLFVPYFSTKETGTGLGLAIAKKVVDEHGGTIEVQSVPGEGTTFTVTFQAERTEVKPDPSKPAVVTA
jgi:signal transduction histidine kinase